MIARKELIHSRMVIHLYTLIIVIIHFIQNTKHSSTNLYVRFIRLMHTPLLAAWFGAQGAVHSLSSCTSCPEHIICSFDDRHAFRDQREPWRPLPLRPLPA